MGGIFSSEKKPEVHGSERSTYNKPTSSRAPHSYSQSHSTRPAATTSHARSFATTQARTPSSAFTPSTQSSIPASNSYRIPRPTTPTLPTAPVVQREYYPEDIFARLSLREQETGTPIYTLSVGHHRVCVFEPARERFMDKKRELISLPNLAEGEIYLTSSISRDVFGELTTPSALRRKQYVQRASFVYGSKESYRELILPALLLGSRVRDFEQRCARVIQMGDLVLEMPPQNKNLRAKPLKLMTLSGQIFEIGVNKVQTSDTDKRWIVECHSPKTPLPDKVRQGCLLEIVNGGFVMQPRVTGALMRYHNGADQSKSRGSKKEHPEDKTAEIENWKLLSAIYGARATQSYPAPVAASALIRLAKLAGTVKLNPEQAEAIERYNCDNIPAFAVESPPGSGKTMTAAAMAVSYTGEGVQLFLSTANVPVINMALALAKLDYGSLKAVHLISSEREDMITDETRSPFSSLSMAKNREGLKDVIAALEAQVQFAPNEEEKLKLRKEISKASSRVLDDDFDVFFATVDMILGRLFKPNQGGRHQKDYIKTKLESDVRRIVVDEASQLTEAALNALILCFPHAQIVLIGDSKQLPPFRYTPGDVVSELAARSALEVIKDKKNLPVIKLKTVYRASEKMMAHYSDVFYGGKLRSQKPETYKNSLACFGGRSAGARCLFWMVHGVAKQSGTSKVNWREIQALKFLVNILKNSGHDEKSVMIISYYEAQRKLAEDQLPEGYEVLTVDSAQGREKKIVIVLTTRTSVPTGARADFFTCALRCNVAVSRHQEAVIVLGHPDIAAAPNWVQVLSRKYFTPVEDRQ